MLHLHAENIFDVENVDNLLAVGRDFGRRNLQTLIRERAGQVIEQAGTVAAIDFDNRPSVGRFIVDQHPRRDREDFRPAGKSRYLL